MAFACGLVVFIGAYIHFSRGLPDVEQLLQYRPPVVSTVYADDGTVIAEFGKERRFVVSLDKIPLTLRQAFIAAEDKRFYRHRGVDLIGLARAVLRSFRDRSNMQGTSTITQQVVRMMFLSPEKKVTRKIKEMILAVRLERKLEKDRILELYLNQIYLGHGAYGVEAAARTFFGKSVGYLNLGECSMMAGLPPAPNNYSPYRNIKAASNRQRYVLYRMAKDGYISQEERELALAKKPDLKSKAVPDTDEMAFYVEHVRRYVEDKYGPDILYKAGLIIYASVNPAFQKSAYNSVVAGLETLDRRMGWRGPVTRLSAADAIDFVKDQAEEQALDPPAAGQTIKALVEAPLSKGEVVVSFGAFKGVLRPSESSWARLNSSARALRRNDVIWVRLKDKPLDGEPWPVVLHQVPEVQSSLLCMENGTGQVKAMIGGYDFTQSQFNRAVQAMRQPGSAFKPFIYAAALDSPVKRYTPTTVIYDTPLAIEDDGGEIWRPRNERNRFYGPTLFRNALAYSRNIVTIKILDSIGVDYAIDYTRKFGITSPLINRLSLALGSSEVSMLEMVTAYSVFANNGLLVEPCFVRKITDRDGRVLEQYVPAPRTAISPDTAFVMTNLMQNVVQYGTGTEARALGRPAAGKTGTTNKRNDAWFIGYTPQYVSGVWVGFDGNKVLPSGSSGGHTAAPIWLTFMTDILKDKPVVEFTTPEEIQFARIDPKTGLLASPDSQDAIFSAFKKDTAPSEYAPEGPQVDEEELFTGDVDESPESAEEPGQEEEEVEPGPPPPAEPAPAQPAAKPEPQPAP